jgi:L-alanine-DL-glutamate epimerase-like enolase superfamily enzyme
MKIVALETLRPTTQSNVCFLRLYIDSGAVGLGEAFYASAAVETYLHDTVAPLLLGVPDPMPEPISRQLAPYAGYQGAGVETRANGAVDIALWDILGQLAGLPLCDLFGGAVREATKVYNTCAGSGYVSTTSRQSSDNWGLPTGQLRRPYEDLDAFLNRPGELARELREEGIGGMKIWPFDQAAERSGGTDISVDELARGIAIVEAIRAAVGFEMDVMVELHALWQRRPATAICQALAPYRPYWVEDPIRSDAVDAIAALRRDVDVPIAGGETCVGRRGFLPLLRLGALDVVTVDVQWTGGLTEARKVAALADTFAVPVAPHDCTGPVSYAACVHLVSSQPNGLVQETVRAFLRTWYDEFATGQPAVESGMVRPSRQPGHGVRLREGIEHRPDVHTRVSRL